MDLDVCIKQLKDNFPDKSIDISEGLELLKETINDTIEKIAAKVNESIIKKDLGKMKQYCELVEEVYNYQNKIEELIKKLDIEELQLNLDECNLEATGDEDLSKRVIPDYYKYTVDNNIEHSLYENFTHIRPFGFKFNDGDLIKCNTWQEVLIKTSEILFNKDKIKFLSFPNNKHMNGKKNKYFSLKGDDMRRPALMLKSIYIETNMSSNSIRNLIIKMLKVYNIKINSYKVYFRADYSELNT